MKVKFFICLALLLNLYSITMELPPSKEGPIIRLIAFIDMKEYKALEKRVSEQLQKKLMDAQISFILKKPEHYHLTTNIFLLHVKPGLSQQEQEDLLLKIKENLKNIAREAFEGIKKETLFLEFVRLDQFDQKLVAMYKENEAISRLKKNISTSFARSLQPFIKSKDIVHYNLSPSRITPHITLATIEETQRVSKSLLDTIKMPHFLAQWPRLIVDGSFISKNK